MKNYTKALECIRKAVELAEKYDAQDALHEFWDSMGEIYFMSGNVAAAIKWYRKAARAGVESSQKWLTKHGYKW